MKPDLDALQRNVALMKDLGFMEERHRCEELQRPQPPRGRGSAAEIDFHLWFLIAVSQPAMFPLIQ